MRVAFEPWFVKYKVDVVFAGHVHAYERSVSSFCSLSFLSLPKSYNYFFLMENEVNPLLRLSNHSYEYFDLHNRNEYQTSNTIL